MVVGKVGRRQQWMVWCVLVYALVETEALDVLVLELAPPWLKCEVLTPKMTVFLGWVALSRFHQMSVVGGEPKTHIHE